MPASHAIIQRHKNRIKMVAIATITLVACAIIGGYLHNQAVQLILKEDANRLEQQVAQRVALIDDSIKNARKQVRFLYSTPPVEGLVRASLNDGVDPFDGTTTELWKQRLQTIFVAFLENNPEVLQARYIGYQNDGQELVRVDRNFGNIFKVPEGQLQQKAHRDYFQAIAKLAPGKVYVSDINLNREQGRVSFPHQPTVRAGIPVYTDSNQLFGMIVLNFDATIMIDRLIRDLPTDFTLYLMNSAGGYLSHPEPVKSFEFEFNESENWAKDFQRLKSDKREPGLQQIINKQSEAVFFAREATYRLSQYDENRFVRLVIAYPYSAYAEKVYQQSTRELIIAGVLLAIMLYIFLAYQINVSKSLKLHETEARFAAIVDGSSDAMISMDQRGVVTGWNAAAQEILQYSSRQAVGHNITDLIVTTGDRVLIQSGINQVVKGETVEPLKFKANTRNGAQLYASISLSLISLDGYKPIGVAAIVRDISDQVEAQERMRDLNSMLEQQVIERTKELEVARNEALSASKAKSNFIANVSHEIRTPLNGITGMLKLLRKTHQDEQRQRYLDMAEASAATLTDLISDVLDLSKIEAGKLELNVQPYDLIELATGVVQSMSMRAVEKDIELILDVADLYHPHLLGDSSRVSQILNNLVGNALKFTHSGWITVTLRSHEVPYDRVQIVGTVEDTGIGIANDKRDSVFSPFSQEDESITREFGGTGLGLSITRQLCQVLQGNVWVESEKGHGSAFHFQLVQQNHGNQASNGLPFLMPNKKFLILDPRQPVAETLKRQLISWQADRVETVVTSDSQALLAQTTDYDLIFIDQSLLPPTELGSEVVREKLVVLRQPLSPNTDGRLPLKELTKPIVPLALSGILRRAELVGASGNSYDKALLVESQEQHATQPQLAMDEHAEACKILVVDDNQINLEVATGLLEDMGYETATALDGRKAIDYLVAHSDCDLVLMDCQMPIMDGYRATREIREGAAGERHKAIPIVAMTASAMAGDREKCMVAGMDDYLTKPVDPQLLQERLHYWLAERTRDDACTDGENIVDINPANQAQEQGPPEQQPLAIWDESSLRKRVGGKKERVYKMVAVFQQTIPERISALRSALAEKKIEKVGVEAHTIKGAAASFGAQRLQKVCVAIELCAKNNHLQETLELEDELVRVSEELMQVLDHNYPMSANEH